MELRDASACVDQGTSFGPETIKACARHSMRRGHGSRRLSAISLKRLRPAR